MTTRRKPDPDRRVRELAAIHVGKKQLELDRETYVALLQRVTGKASSADLDGAERHAVIEEMRRLGAAKPATSTPRGPARAGVYPGRPANVDTTPMLTKVEALLVELDAPWAYADAIAQRMFRVERVAWLRQPEQLRAVIAALDARRKKQQPAVRP